MTLEEFLIELLARDIDPGQRSREYIEASTNIIVQAREELEKGDLRQASEKI